MGRLGDWGLPTVVLASQTVVCVLPSVFRHACAPCMTHHPHTLLGTAMQLWFVPTIMAAAGLAESIPGAPEDPVIKTFVCNTQVNAGAISPLKPHVGAILPRSCVLVWRGNLPNAFRDTHPGRARSPFSSSRRLSLLSSLPARTYSLSAACTTRRSRPLLCAGVRPKRIC